MFAMLNLKYLFDKVHEKYSIPNKEKRTYHHYFYEVDKDINGEYFSLNELLQKDFIDNVSHEIKTPINSIQGFTKLLDDNTWEKVSNRNLELTDIRYFPAKDVFFAGGMSTIYKSKGIVHHAGNFLHLGLQGKPE